MARSVEANDSGEPTPPAKRAWRYFGDGFAGRLVAARIQGYDPSTLGYVDVQVDSSGVVQTAGGTGGGGGGAATIADGADVAQGSTTDLSSANTVVGLLKAIKAAVTGTLSIRALTSSDQVTVANASIPVTDNAGSLTVDAPVGTPVWVRLSDGSAAYVGQKVAASSIPVVIASDQSSLPTTDSRLPSALGANGGLKIEGVASGTAVPVSMATQTPDVTDRAARLLGHVTVDSAPTTAVTGPLTDTQLRASAVPVSGSGVFHVDDNAASLTVDAPVGTPVFARLSDGAAALIGSKVSASSLPVVIASDQADVKVNLDQIAGTALAAKAVPTNADGQVAIPVYVNAQQYATYDVAARAIVSGALTAGTAKAVMSIEHALASTKTVRIRRIMIHMIQTTALSGLIDVQITRGTAASSAGSAITPQPRRITDPAAECVVKSLPTIVAASVADNIPAGGFATTTTLYSPPVLIYDWQEAGETKPYLLVAGALQSLVINVVSTAAHNLTLTVSLDLTEE